MPVALVGSLADNNNIRGQRLGETLLIACIAIGGTRGQDFGIYAVVVDALDESARSFYLKYGFNELTDDHLHLYLPMKVIVKLNL